MRERILPSPNHLSVNSISPKASNALLVGSSSHIRGNVILGEESSVLFNCFIECIPKEGNEQVYIGKRTIIKDLVSIKAQRGGSTNIGSNCIVEGNSSILNSTIEDEVYIGLGCRVVNSTILKGAYLAPGTVVENATIGAQEVVCKNPYEVLRTKSAEESEYLSQRLLESKEISQIIADFSRQNSTEIESNRRYMKLEEFETLPDMQKEVDQFHRYLEDKNLPSTENDLQLGHYRDWLLEDMENRRLFGYKDSEFEPSTDDMRPKELFGAYHEDFLKHIDLHEKSKERKGKLTEPDFDNDSETIDYKKNIQERNNESNKY